MASLFQILGGKILKERPIWSTNNGDMTECVSLWHLCNKREAKLLKIQIIQESKPKVTIDSKVNGFIQKLFILAPLLILKLFFL